MQPSSKIQYPMKNRVQNKAIISSSQVNSLKWVYKAIGTKKKKAKVETSARF